VTLGVASDAESFLAEVANVFASEPDIAVCLALGWSRHVLVTDSRRRRRCCQRSDNKHLRIV